MQPYTFDPRQDSRWADFVASDPQASVFHQLGWLKALAGTYGYRPLVLTSATPGEALSDGIVFCEVDSWITGKRLVSLPFADHAQPLADNGVGASQLSEWMRTQCDEQNWKYFELRPLCWKMRPESAFTASQSFWFHTLSLEPSTEQLFRGLHKSCIQRRIRRAEHEQLSYERGHSEELINDFYRLQLITRRRHGLLPQPRAWFQNLIACMSPNVDIRLARKDGKPIASILTLSHRGTVVYKYGCSDERFHHLGAMPFLFWKLIEESKEAGAEQIDFGRTDLDNAGLIEFKDRLGATRRQITYLRYPRSSQERGAVAKYLPWMRHIFSVLPDPLSSLAGRALYRHIG
jgi:CelD/BcsL family acetyltransferase involved in cellulose biosynthesis